ncbi:MAG: DUF1444 family protein [Pseudomonadota bacterium]
MKFLIVFAAVTSFFVSANAAFALDDALAKRLVRRFEQSDLVDDVKIIDKHTLKITPKNGTETQVNLENLEFEISRASSEDEITALIDIFIAGYAKTVTAAPRTVEEFKKAVLPTIRPRDISARMIASIDSVSSNRGIVDKPVEGDKIGNLSVYYVEDYENAAKFITEGTLSEFNLLTNEIAALAIENLKAYISQWDIQIIGDNGVYMFAMDGYYESSLLLVDAVWEPVKSNFKGHVVAIVLSKDVLLFADSGQPDSIAALFELAKNLELEGAPLAESNALISSPNGWQPYQSTSDQSK